MDRRLGAFLAFCVALVAAVASHWGGVRLVDVVRHTHRADAFYELVYHGGPAVALAAALVCVALLFSSMRDRDP